MKFSVTATQRGAVLALGLALAVVACDNKTVVTPPVVGTHAKVSLKPKAPPSISVLGNGETASASPGGPSPDPSTLPVASPSATPPLAVSAPPLIFPYVKNGVAWQYILKVKLSAVGATVTGAVSIGVKSTTADGATLMTSFILTDLTPASIPLPNQGKVTAFTGDVKKDVSNPYALGVLFPKAGSKVTDTVTKVETESLTVAGGTFDTTKYTINEQADAGKSIITLWTAKDGSMVKESIAGDKPPPLVDFSALGPMASMVNGPTTTTLELKSVGVTTPDATGSGAVDPHATGAASADPNATHAASADPNATHAASADPNATPAASADPNATGTLTPSPTHT
jgi:hypothetical protein